MFIAPSPELLFPELEDGNIFAIIEGFFSEIFIGQHSGNIEEGCLGAIEESEESITEDMLKARTPGIAEHTLQNANNLGGDVRLLRGVGYFERIKGDRERSIGGVKIDDVFYSRLGNKPEVVDGEVAVGVDNTVALVIINIGEREKFEESGFTGAGLTDNVNVAGAVAAEKPELVVDAAEVC